MLDSIIFSKVLEGWRNDKIVLLPSNTEAEIISVFEKLNSRCSNDVIELYCTTGGMDEMDEKYFTLWSLETIAIVNSTTKIQDVAFADFIISSHNFYLHYENRNHSSIYADYSGEIEPNVYTKVANSVSDFFEIYLNNPAEIGLIL